MTDLPADVTLSYRGIAFGNSLKTSVSGKPIYDAAGRVAVYVVYTINAEAVFHVPFAPGNDVTDTSEELRRALTKPGGELVLAGQGNDFGINTTDADVRWGPKPTLLAFEPVGKQQCVKVKWQCEVAIMECDPQGQRGIPPGSIRHPMEFNYTLNFAIDQSGYTRRTYAGHVVIAQTRKAADDLTVADTADRLRKDIAAQVPKGFRRESQTFNLSADKCRLDFTLVDVQLPENVPPEGVVLVNAAHTMTTEALSMVQWRGSIQADYEVALGVPRSAALGHFLALVNDRTAEARAKAEEMRARGQQGDGKRKVTLAVIPRSLTLTEPEIYGRRSASFSLTYSLTLPLDEIEKSLGYLGLFRRAPGSDWAKWNGSLTAHLGVRGHAGLYHKASDDKLISLCVAFPLKSGDTLPGENTPALPQERGGLGGGILRPAVPQEKGGLGGGILSRRAAPVGGGVTPATSWLAYSNELIVETEDDVIEVKNLPVAPVRQTRGQQGEVEAGTGGYLVPYSDAPGSVIQLRSKPVVAIVLQGYALRAGYDIAPPELESVGGQTPVQANRAGVEYWRTRVVANFLTPVVGAAWRMRWLMPNLPAGRLGSPANPMLGGVTQAGGKQEFGGLAN